MASQSTRSGRAYSGKWSSRGRADTDQNWIIRTTSTPTKSPLGSIATTPTPAKASPSLRAGTSEGPPGLSLRSPEKTTAPRCSSNMAPVTPSPDEFGKSQAARPLPKNLDGTEMHERFKSAILSCIEGLYVDRVYPTIGEVQKRLRGGPWGFTELQAILPLCAKHTETFQLLPPSRSQQPLILLRNRPAWFSGWVDDETAPDTYSSDVWKELHNVLMDMDAKKPQFRFSGGLSQLAVALHKQKVGPTIGALSLGELKNIVRLAAGPHRKFLAHDVLHGGRLTKSNCLGSASLMPRTPAIPEFMPAAVPVTLPMSPMPTAPPVSEISMPLAPPPGLAVEEDPVTQNLRQRPLPECFGKGLGDPETQRRCRTVKSCLESLYRDRIEPTHSEVQQRLRQRGWGAQELPGLLALCARMPQDYHIVLPESGMPLRIYLRNPPTWFEGWLSNDGSYNISPEVWPVFANFLQAECPVLSGTVNAAAHDLRQLALPQPLQQMSLGEIREVVKHAVAEHDLLTYSGWTMCATQAMLQSAWSGDSCDAHGQLHFASI